jgi:O-antigen/teichoic acid export membrane protein
VSRFYRPRVLINAVVLGVAALLHTLGALGAATICWISAAAAAATGSLYRRASAPYFQWPHEGAPEEGREMRRYLAPLWPGMIFYAFHGQIQLFLISVFGSTRSVAEVSALGRIGQVLVFVTAFVSTILVPMVARASREQLARAYGRSVALVFAFCSALLVSALLFPRVYLLLLGSKYAGLQTELGLAVAASAAAFFCSSLFVFNNARRWTRHGSVIASIVGAIAIDLAFVFWGDLGHVRGVLWLSVATNLFPLLPFGWTAWQGFRREEVAA